MFTDILILAGGSGDRLWPASDTNKPKQFLAFPNTVPWGGDTFLQATIRRAIAMNISGKICIVTRKNWIEQVIQDIKKLAEESGQKGITEKILVMGEPCGKNTAPAIAWVSEYLLKLDRQEPVYMLVLPSDHIIQDTDKFIADMETASFYAEQNNIVTFAVKPSGPETGYGYLKLGSRLTSDNSEHGSVFKVEQFCEKPDRKTAEIFISKGNYYWNSGIYGFRADFFLGELEKYAPEVFHAFRNCCNETDIETCSGIQAMKNAPELDTAYAETPSISIDYAVSEKSERVTAVKISFSWDDAGTWDAISKYDMQDSAQITQVDGSDNFVFSDIPVALCGVDDLIVVIKNGRCLVCKKGDSNKVKDIVSIINNLTKAKED
ncbi:MAG: mannose-1-phosphate guanylyltransferase [Spirochaetaceae bacterium]|jgi:mannose-1-phosphate guanylyltransferase/mannose-6-phosphate isomerase|nr:mannose-1-phosphate guanylyltransferase [Spirochaetaceae bacterium]